MEEDRTRLGLPVGTRRVRIEAHRIKLGRYRLNASAEAE